MDRVRVGAQFLQFGQSGFPLGLKSLDRLLGRFAAGVDFTDHADCLRLHPYVLTSCGRDRAGRILGPGRGGQEHPPQRRTQQKDRFSTHGKSSV
jgi:hypothetical protein